MLIAPFALAIGLAAAFFGLLSYVHHDGTLKGYHKHEIEVAEAIKATNARVAFANKRAAEEIAKANEERDAAFERASVRLGQSQACVLTEELRADINRVSRK